MLPVLLALLALVVAADTTPAGPPETPATPGPAADTSHRRRPAGRARGPPPNGLAARSANERAQPAHAGSRRPNLPLPAHDPVPSLDPTARSKADPGEGP